MPKGSFTLAAAAFVVGVCHIHVVPDNGPTEGLASNGKVGLLSRQEAKGREGADCQGEGEK